MRILPPLLLLLLSNFAVASIDEARESFNKGEIKQAEKLFTQALETADNTAIASSYLGRISIRNTDFDSAKDYALKAHKLSPNNAEVESNYAIVMASMAQQANIFKKLGYAKKSLAGFSKAVELEPENVNYRQSLMSYYIGAPGIAGGDNDLALQQALAIRQLDEMAGLQALLTVYSATEDEAAIKKLFAGLTPEQQQNPELLFMQGLYSQSSKQYDLATEQFKQAISFSGSEDAYKATKFGALYQIGRTSVLSKQNITAGIKALEEYMQTAPKLGGLPSKEWAAFRLANLQAESGNQAAAKATYTHLAKTSKDINLQKQLKEIL